MRCRSLIQVQENNIENYSKSNLLEHSFTPIPFSDENVTKRYIVSTKVATLTPRFHGEVTMHELLHPRPQGSRSSCLSLGTRLELL